MSTIKSTNGKSSPGQIRIARRRRIPGGATIGTSGNSNDGATIADGAGKIGVVGVSRVEVVGNDDGDATLLLNLISIASLGETIGATDMGGGELSDGSASDDE
ncbi:hypothetical protein Tco_0954892 [Tanacetum coccineum]|uniref:Uncharacterized protein n=1 Tax=Tanacetum coccineum TaxID=301880 RepID=A0ABQ5E5P7_9ASTR